MSITAGSSQANLAVCRAKGLPICEPESSKSTNEEIPLVPHEIKELPPPAKYFECDYVKGQKLPVSVEEEQSLERLPTVAEERLLDDIRDELDKWKIRVEQVDRILSLNTPECNILDPCADTQVELQQDNVAPEIVHLQRNNHKLRQHLEEMQRSCTAADFSLRHLRKGLCRDLEAGLQLQRHLGELDSFQRNMEREHVLCAERFRFLERDKYDWDSCFAYINKENSASQKKHSKFVAMVDYQQPRQEVDEKLKQTKIEVKSLHNFIYRHMFRETELSDVTQPPTLRLGSELSAYVQRNEEIFGKDLH